ncbi:hypothetical protein [Williamwhitmania taraxaci]|uniref:hypothetical protein n=1 Tax=Williamwhitmania taraxaci TaxID=1640674 RepID=UPI000B89300B|nr:hypothetical protein [Williamwhitmania taraxaci]
MNNSEYNYIRILYFEDNVSAEANRFSVDFVFGWKLFTLMESKWAFFNSFDCLENSITHSDSV